MESKGTTSSPRRNVGTLLFALGAALSLSACALSYVDDRGDTHYRGLLVHVTVPKSNDQRDIRAESVRVQSFGLSLLSGLQRTNFTLGYNDETMTLVRGGTCVAFNTAKGEIPHDQ